ncbi:MAG: hypothetical protein Kow0090_00540 [Myxococcota bacterium]
MKNILSVYVATVTLFFAACSFEMEEKDFVFAEDKDASSDDVSVCQLGATECVGSEVRRCNKEGELEFVENCADKGLVCDEGVCKRRICEPTELKCEDNRLAECNEKGTGYNYTDCAAGKSCIEEGDAPYCG